MEDGIDGHQASGRDRTSHVSDPLQDTMPWIPEDDPILKELRAWRSELGTNGSAAAPVAEQDSQAAAPTAVWGPQTPTAATSSPASVEPTRSSEPKRRQASRHVREPMGPRRVADEMPWFSFGR